MSADPTAAASPDLAQLQGMLAVSQRNLELSDRGRLEEAARRYEVEQQLAAEHAANGTLREAHQRLEAERNETAERVTPVPSCVTITVAPGTTASEGSVTVPVMAAFPPPWP